MDSGEEDKEEGEVKRKDPKGPVAVEPGKIMRGSLCLYKPAGDEVTGKHEKKVYARPSGEPGMQEAEIMPDEDP